MELTELKNKIINSFDGSKMKCSTISFIQQVSTGETKEMKVNFT